MLNRTSESNKAIAEAWEKEKKRVLEGKGTLDWTPKQQQDILDKGKAYDENGKAFEGHHMKSVEAYPEFQGESKNIQFLSRDKHKAAHNGNYQNPTNGYYDPNTGETKMFNDSTYEPCKADYLSIPTATCGETNVSLQHTETVHESQITVSIEEEIEQSI